MKEYIQDSYTLRLMLSVDKLNTIDEIVFMFNLLQHMDRHKAIYIMNAIKHYDIAKNDNADVREALFPIRCMKYIKSYYSLETREDVEKLLATGTDSATFKNAEEKMIKRETPRVMLIGFSKKDPEQVEMHNRLFQMDVNERLLLIAKALEVYVKDGLDPDSLAALSYNMVHDSILEYEVVEDKATVVDNFYLLLQKSDMVVDKYKAL